MHEDQIAQAILALAHEVKHLTQALTDSKPSDGLTKQDLDQLGNKIMSAISEQIAQSKANLDAVDAKLDAIVAGIASLDAKITALQNSPGTLSPEDQAALDAIVTESANLKAKADAIDADGASLP